MIWKNGNNEGVGKLTITKRNQGLEKKNEFEKQMVETKADGCRWKVERVLS